MHRNLLPSTPEGRDDTKLDLAAEVLRNRGTVRLKAWGTSMLPSVWPGDLLTIQSVGADEIVPGDIVLVLRDSRFFIHRLVESRRDQVGILCITRGDAMPHNDPPNAASELLGRVAGIRRADQIFVPGRRLSTFHSALASTAWRWNRFSNLTLRIYSARPALLPRSAQFCQSVLGAMRKIFSMSSSERIAHP
jgi:hypothetical protein